MAPPGGLLISALGYGVSVELPISSATEYLLLLPVFVLFASRPAG
jgi:hypothetical protein